MNLPECNPYFDQAVDTVVTVINLAKSRLGVRQNLTEFAGTCVHCIGIFAPAFRKCRRAVRAVRLDSDAVDAQLNGKKILYAETRKGIALPIKVPLDGLKRPLDKTGEKFLMKTIEKRWFLTPMFKYTLRFMGTSKDEIHHCFYYEVVFSQPTPEYPIPQATVSVFFRLEENYTIPLGVKPTPFMYFRIEGQYSEHDVRLVALTVDWLASILKMKTKLYERIENLNIF